MIRIGIMGSDNTHSIAFAKLINRYEEGIFTPYGDPIPGAKVDFSDMRVVGIMGDDAAENQKALEEGGMDFIAENAQDFVGRVDAMMIDYRRGGRHIEILPFIEAGLPCFIDKPLTYSMADAYAITDAAAKSGAPIMGGSSFKQLGDVLKLKEIVATGDPIGELISAAAYYRADTKNMYDGLFFYAPHLVEMALTVFGYDMRSVIAVDKNGPFSAIARYDKFDIHLMFTNNDRNQPGCLLVGTKASHYMDISLNDGYLQEMTAFADMLRSCKSHQTHEQLVMPVAVLNALQESVDGGGKEVAITKFLR
ncbi:MAG: hypothetical protein FWD16_01265 [Clostridia bacterium]|nr:hypothetical protein [Clostridia bacterium]